MQIKLGLYCLPCAVEINCFLFYLADSYSLPHGVFLFLGYSEMDENLLRPHINLTIQDSVDALQQVMRFEPPATKVRITQSANFREQNSSFR